MEFITGLLVATHALLGAVFLGGLIGRWIVLGMAERGDTLARMQTLTRAARPGAIPWCVPRTCTSWSSSPPCSC
jgi:hypothetical protein